jgi:hypothetical protein
LRVKATKIKINKEEIMKKESGSFLGKIFKNDVKSITLKYFPYWIGKIVYESGQKQTDRVGLMAISDQTKLAAPILTDFMYEEMDVDDNIVVKPKLNPDEVKKLLIKSAENYALLKKKDMTIFLGKAKLKLVELILVYRPFWEVEYVKGGGIYYEADGYFTRE